MLCISLRHSNHKSGEHDRESVNISVKGSVLRGFVLLFQYSKILEFKVGHFLLCIGDSVEFFCTAFNMSLVFLKNNSWVDLAILAL